MLLPWGGVSIATAALGLSQQCVYLQRRVGVGEQWNVKCLKYSLGCGAASASQDKLESLLESISALLESKENKMPREPQGGMGGVQFL